MTQKEKSRNKDVVFMNMKVNTRNNDKRMQGFKGLAPGNGTQLLEGWAKDEGFVVIYNF